MTGYGQPDDRARAFEAGFDDHVVKPVSVEELSAAIERMRSKKMAARGSAAQARRRTLSVSAGELVAGASRNPPAVSS